MIAFIDTEVNPQTKKVADESLGTGTFIHS